MVKKVSNSKAKTVKGATGVMDSHLASSVKESAHQIWLAGMGAFSKAQVEGTKVFEALIKEGLHLQKKTQGIAENKIDAVADKMSAMADTVTAKAGQNWDKLEAIFEARTAKALNKLGVPTAKEVDALIKRVDALAVAVSKLPKSAPVKTRRAVKKAAPVARVPAAVVKLPARRARKAAAPRAVATKPAAAKEAA